MYNLQKTGQQYSLTCRAITPAYRFSYIYLSSSFWDEMLCI